ncbi:MAG: hypothetical protein ACRD3L_02255 [Terriglobales bacterium]
MLAGAILVVGQTFRERGWAGDSWRTTGAGTLAGTPIACVELLGQSVLDRVVQKLQRDGVMLITILVREGFSHLAQTPATRSATIRPVRSHTNLWSAAESALYDYVQHGVESVLLTALGAYTELDLGHLIRFHRHSGQGVTFLTKDHEPLDYWVIEAAEARKMRRLGLPGLMDRERLPGIASYALPGYVGQLREASDLRRLAVDGFLSRCSVRPQGREVKPGIWLGEGTQVHRRARIVAPAYLGRGAVLRADTLLTRFSALEHGCVIDDGSVIEDASVLANTYVGKGLNVSHAVVDGNRLHPLRQNIEVEIRDGKLLRRTMPVELGRSSAGGADGVSLAERLLATAWN